MRRPALPAEVILSPFSYSMDPTYNEHEQAEPFCIELKSAVLLIYQPSCLTFLSEFFKHVYSIGNAIVILMHFI